MEIGGEEYMLEPLPCAQRICYTEDDQVFVTLVISFASSSSPPLMDVAQQQITTFILN